MDSIPVIGEIFDLIGFLLAQIYSVVPNLGIAIILLTLMIMLLLYPLTAKQTRSMLAMQAVQPEIKKLQAKYKHDRQKLNEETMKFYQENKINPLAGCLPLFLQMPILIALFGVLRDAHKYVPKSSSLFADLCHDLVNATGKAACGTDATTALIELNNHPEGVVKGAPLIHHLHFLGLDLQKAATAAHDGFIDALPYFILVGLVIISYMVSTRQAQKRTPAANKQMGTVMKILPPFFGLISITLPSGVVVYLFVSSVFRVVQQGVIFNRHGHILTSRAKPTIDVKGSDRTAPARPAKESRPRPPAPVTRPAAEKVAPRGPTPVEDHSRSGGMRGRMGLPPPPVTSGNGADRPVADDDPAPGGSSPSKRAAPSRRRRNKKRKR